MTLIHICCSVDSHFFLKIMQEQFKDEELLGYFYDPNIHPLAEYELRFKDVQRSCKALGIRLIKGEYDYDAWYEKTKNEANEPERGKRCISCFEFRLQSTFVLAKRLGIKKISSTLFASPKKSKEQLLGVLNNLCKENDIEIILPDIKAGGSLQRQMSMAKQALLYHQNYCGCIYALKKQRKSMQEKVSKGGKNQEKISCGEAFVPELFSDIYARVQPASIEEKDALYQKVALMQENKQHLRLVRTRMLNYRLLFAKVMINKSLSEAYILFFSHFAKSYYKFNIDCKKDGICFVNKGAICLMGFDYFNNLLAKEKKSFEDLMQNPLDIDTEKAIRKELFGDFSLTPIIIIKELGRLKLEITAFSKIFESESEKIWQK